MACRASHASSSARLSAAIQPDCLPCFEPVHSHAKKKPAASHTKPIRHASTDACTLPPMQLAHGLALHPPGSWVADGATSFGSGGDEFAWTNAPTRILDQGDSCDHSGIERRQPKMALPLPLKMALPLPPNRPVPPLYTARPPTGTAPSLPPGSYPLPQNEVASSLNVCSRGALLLLLAAHCRC